MMPQRESKTRSPIPDGDITITTRALTSAHLGRPQQGPGRGNPTAEEITTMHPCPGADERRARALMLAAMRPRGAFNRTASTVSAVNAQVSGLTAPLSHTGEGRGR